MINITHLSSFKYIAIKVSIILISILSLVSCKLADKELSRDINQEKIMIERNITTVTKDMKTHDLVVPDNIKFTSHSDINLTINIKDQGGAPAYITLYSKYENKDSTLKADSDSKILAGSLIKDVTDYSLSVPQHINTLLLEVWFYDGRKVIKKEVDIYKNIIVKL